MRNIVCIIQARMGSTRLPGKVMLILENKPVLLRVVDRVLESKQINRVVVATTTSPNDEAIVDLVKDYHPKVAVFRGSDEDVLDRYYQAAKKYRAEIIVRITSDCPLVDSEIIDKIINKFLEEETDYASNVFGKRTYPKGLDVEVFSFDALQKTWQETKEKDNREHVTLYIRKNPGLFKCRNVESEADYSYHRWTLDEEDDFKLIKIVYQELYHKNPKFKMKEIIELFNQNPDLIKINQHVEQKLANF